MSQVSVTVVTANAEIASGHYRGVKDLVIGTNTKSA